MQPKSPKLLEDIRESADYVLQVTAGKTLADFRGDRLLRQAVERNFEIIGEALSRLAKLDPETAGRVSDYQRIIAFRNVLIHGYDAIADERVWDIINHRLPPLLDEVRAILPQANSRG